MDAVKQEVQWSDDVLMLLNQVAESIVSAVAQIQTGEILQKQKAENRIIKESINSLILIMNAAGVITDSNESCKKMLGYDATDMIGEPIERYISLADVESVYTVLGDVLAGRPIREFASSFRHHDRSVVSISINASLLQVDEKHSPAIIFIVDLVAKPDSYKDRHDVNANSLFDHLVSG